MDNTVAIGGHLRGNTYKIEGVLGQGGFGITYLADFAALKTKVAIKEFFLSGYCVRNPRDNSIAPQSLPAETFRQYKDKFIEEAQTLAQFNHPGIVQVTDVFEENNTAYFVMKHIKGKPLAQLIRERRKISEREAVAYITQAAEALQAVHRRNILHRDIKPENIMITEDDKAVLIDFGTARAFADGRTITHTTMLTPGYAPMEQYSDRQRRGFYTDIYALGATLYACLAGKAPLPAIDRLSRPAIEKIPGVSGPVFRTIEKALEMEPEARFQDIRSFLESIGGREPAAKEPAIAYGARPGRTAEIPGKGQGAFAQKMEPEEHLPAVRPEPRPSSGNRGLIMAIIAAAVVVAIGLFTLLLDETGGPEAAAAYDSSGSESDSAETTYEERRIEDPPAKEVANTGPRQGTVTSGPVNTRSSPGITANNRLKLQLQKGDKVTVLEEQASSGNTRDKRTIRKTIFRSLDGKEFEITRGVAVKYISDHGEDSYVRLLKNDGSSQTGYIRSSDLETMAYQKWYKVRYKGQEVWAHSDYIQID